jgi:putative ABC transport system permease protein
MGALIQDLRYAVRLLQKSPGFTAVAVLTLALGIGANMAMFSVVNGLLRPLPVKAPEQIAVLAAQVKGASFGFDHYFSYPALLDFRKQADTFSDLFAYQIDIGGLSADGKAYHFLFSYVTGNYFSALGIKPAVGRLFLPDEGEQPGIDPLLVLGFSYWQKRFGGDASIVGKRVLVDGRPVTIVGVVPEKFHGVYSLTEMDGYLPLSILASGGLWTDRSQRGLTVLGRLKPDVSLAQAQSSVNVITERLAEQYPATDKGIAAHVVFERLARPVPEAAEIIPVTAGLFLVLAVLVLLLACVNVANILLVRATVRQREMAIRAALGSGRGRLIRQLLTESVLLAFLGGVAGLILGNWTSGLISSIRLETDLPVLLDFSFDWRVFTYALTAVLCAGIAVGVWPALRASRGDVSAVLHKGGRSDSAGGGRHRVRNVLVVVQVAGSLMLLIIAGLFVRSLERAQQTYLGFDPDHVLNVAMDPHLIGYDEPRTKTFYHELEARVRALPAVQSASLAYGVPMGSSNDGSTVYVQARPVTTGQPPPLVLYNRIDPGYFETMRVPLLRGRAFTESDKETAPLVAIVNQTMARQFWPNQNPIGKRFSMKSATGPWVEVVGEVRDGKYLTIFGDTLSYFYVPFAQNFTSMRVLQIRSLVPPESLANLVEREIRALDSGMPISDLRTMRQSLAGINGFMIFRLGASLAGAMGILGLTLAVVGVYGVVSFAASQRTREIGVRMALGANRRDVLSLVLGQGVWLVIAGLLAGMVGALAITRVMADLLFVSATDPMTFVVASLLLGSVALLACYIPARRATKVDPMVALRYE